MAESIVIRGYHDTGKSTLARSLIKYFDDRGEKAILYQFEKTHHGLVPNRFYGVSYGMVPNKTLNNFGEALIKGFDYYIFEIRMPITSSPTRSVAVDLFQNQYELSSNFYDIILSPKVEGQPPRTERDIAHSRIDYIDKRFHRKEELEEYFFSLFNIPTKRICKTEPNVIKIRNKESCVPFNPVYTWDRKERLVDATPITDNLKTNPVTPRWEPKKTGLKAAAVGGIHGEWDFLFDITWFDMDLRGFYDAVKEKKYDLAIIGGFSNIDVSFRRLFTDIPIICYHPSLFSKIFNLRLCWNAYLPPNGDATFCPICWKQVYDKLKYGKRIPVVPENSPCYRTQRCYAVLNNQYLAWSSFSVEGMNDPIEMRENVLLLKYFIHPYYLVKDGWLDKILGVI